MKNYIVKRYKSPCFDCWVYCLMFKNKPALNFWVGTDIISPDKPTKGSELHTENLWTKPGYARRVSLQHFRKAMGKHYKGLKAYYALVK